MKQNSSEMVFTLFSICRLGRQQLESRAALHLAGSEQLSHPQGCSEGVYCLGFPRVKEPLTCVRCQSCQERRQRAPARSGSPAVSPLLKEPQQCLDRDVSKAGFSARTHHIALRLRGGFRAIACSEGWLLCCSQAGSVSVAL